MNRERQVRNSFIYLLPTVVGALLPIISLPIFTRILSREEYGAWALVVAYGTFISGLANFGLVIAYERNFFQYPSPRERSALLYSSITFVMTALLVFAGITWLFRHEMARAITKTAANGNLLFLAFCGTGLASIKAYYLTYFKNTHDAAAYVRYTLDENVLNVAFSLFLVAYLRVGVVGLVVGQLLASALVLSVLMFRFLRRLPFSFDGHLLKQSLKLSYPLAPRLLLNVVSTQFDKYMIGMVGSIGGVGIYVIGQKVARMVMNFMVALENVFAPQVYERMFSHAAGGEETVGRYLTPYAYVSVGAALMIGLLSEEVVNLLTAPAFHDASVIVNILVMYYAIMFFGKQPQLMFAKKTYLISVLSMIGIGINAVFVILGIKLWGAAGAAWGTLASGMTAVFLYMTLGQRYAPIRWQWWRLGAIFGSFFASVILLLAMRGLGINYNVRLLSKVIFAVVYLWIGIRIEVLSRGNLGMLRGALTRVRPGRPVLDDQLPVT